MAWGGWLRAAGREDSADISTEGLAHALPLALKLPARAIHPAASQEHYSTSQERTRRLSRECRQALARVLGVAATGSSEAALEDALCGEEAVQSFKTKFAALREVDAAELSRRYLVLSTIGAKVFEYMPDLVALGLAGDCSGLRHCALPYQSDALLSDSSSTSTRRSATKSIAQSAMYASSLHLHSRLSCSLPGDEKDAPTGSIDLLRRMLPADADAMHGAIGLGPRHGSMLSRQLASVLPLGAREGWWSAAMHATAVTEASKRPLFRINRFKAHAPAAAGTKNSVLGQLLGQLLKIHPVQLRAVQASPHLPYEVKLSGERVVGETGPFREVLADLSHDLTPPQLVTKLAVAEIGKGSDGDPGTGTEEGGPEDGSSAASESSRAQTSPHPHLSAMGLFVVTPNTSSSFGPLRGTCVPAPGRRSSADLSLYRGVGRLIGSVFRTGQRLALRFHPLVWAALAGHEARFSLHQLRGIHAHLSDNVLGPMLACSSEDEWEDTFEDAGIEPEAVLADGTKVNWLPASRAH